MNFPLVEAILEIPPEGKNGKIGICTNTLAPRMVLNEIVEEDRSDVAAIGSLVVNRDGAERMIVNALTHPTIQYIILFGDETLSFRPSTNLLQALMEGYDPSKPGNVIKGGKGIAFQYPSITPPVLDSFRQNVVILPLFMAPADGIVEKYMEWLKPRIPEAVWNSVKKWQDKKKFYYDALGDVVRTIHHENAPRKEALTLDPKEFQHLQPPVVNVEGKSGSVEVPFDVHAEGEDIVVRIDTEKGNGILRGKDSFLLAYSIMEKMRALNVKWSPLQELALGAEISRVEIQIKNTIESKSFFQSTLSSAPREEWIVASQTIMKPDPRFYYKISVKDEKLRVQSMAHDTCETVVEWRATELIPLLEKMAQENRFASYEQESLHRMYVGSEVARAVLALQHTAQFLQDFSALFFPNSTQFPFIVVDGDSFLGNHQKIVTQLFLNGVTMRHADVQKGMMRSAAILSIFRRAGESLKSLPRIYAQGTQTPEDMRTQYCAELSSPEAKGTYTYGNRTKSYFGRDQLEETIEFLRTHPEQPYVIQRMDYVQDMGVHTTTTDDKGKTRTRVEATHDPCLTHDIYFIQGNRLHSFHIARAHNMVNAYPENIFGLHDAYDRVIADTLKVEMGDLFMLSNRGNILLLTEEQRARKIMNEPSKPVGELNKESGPYSIHSVYPSKGVGMLQVKLENTPSKPMHASLDVIETYEGVNILEKSIQYLKDRGTTHNNPILGAWNPKNPIMDDAHRLIFFQCNEQGGKLHSTGVFLQGEGDKVKGDLELCQYFSTQYSQKLGVALGELIYISLPWKGV